MRAKIVTRAAVLAAVGLLVLSACGSDNPTGENPPDPGAGGLSGTLSGVGASSQQAVITAWESGFSYTQPGASVQYSPDGSGAGRKAFLAGGASFAGSDAHLTTSEYEQSKEVCGDGGALNIPVYTSPIAIAFNLPGIDSLNLDPETIAKIFRGEISSWSDTAITSQNTGVDIPDIPITVVHRSDDSGTTENFTEYLAAAAGDAWGKAPDGEWPSDYAGESNKGTAGVVATTSATRGAITYADASATGNLGGIKVKVAGDYVELSADSAAKTVEISARVSGGNERDMAIDVNRTPDTSEAYPVVLVSYHIVCTSYSSQSTAELVKAYELYVVSEEGQQAAAAAASSAPLTDSLRSEARQAIESIGVSDQ